MDDVQTDFQLSGFYGLRENWIDRDVPKKNFRPMKNGILIIFGRTWFR